MPNYNDMETVRVTRAILDLLEARGISHRFGGGERWREGDSLFHAPDLELEPYCAIHAGQVLPARMGAFSYTGSQLLPSTRMGRYCSIGSGVRFIQTEHPLDWASTSPFSYSPAALEGLWRYLAREAKVTEFPAHRFDGKFADPVVLGNDVWVGDNVTFSGGVSVGDGAVVGANALVTRDVAPYAIVGGVPARTIRMRFPEALVERLRKIEWWRFGPEVLQPLDVRDAAGFVSRLEDSLTESPPRPLILTRLAASELRAAAD